MSADDTTTPEPGTGGGLFHDERGSLSAARIFLAVDLIQTISYIFLVTLTDRAFSNAVLGFDGSSLTILASWAGGARIAQYIAPQASAVATGIGAALKEIVQRRANGDTEHTP